MAVCRARLEVSVSGVAAKEEVRVSGNVEELGKWNLDEGVPLTRKRDNSETWTVELDLPCDVTIEYRYVVVEHVRTQEKDFFNVSQWETSKHPRHFCFRETKHKSGEKMTFEKNDGKFGDNEAGGGGSERGWLMELSELQLQLHCSEESPIRIDTMPPNTQYSVKIKTINYCAKTEDVCERCQSTPVIVKVLDRLAGECELVEQSEHGHPYTEQHMLVFSTQAPTFSYCSFLVDIFDVSASEAKKVGRASILPQQLKKDEGKLILTVFSVDLLPVGTITMSYLLIHPVKECPSLHSVKHSRVNYWSKHNRGLDIGHRGLGNSYLHNDELTPSVVENTIGSLKEAGEHGADYVEFDVQLTKDLVPVVYHDFHVCTTVAKAGFSSGELYEMYVKDLTLQQLHSLRLEHTSVLDQQGKEVTFATADRTRSDSTSSDSSTDSEADAHCTTPLKPLGSCSEEELTQRTFPTLEQVFKAVPPHTGFNIEIKYPLPEQGHDKYSFEFFGRNMMADIILRTVYRHAHHRKIMFSCFDPDMCTILRRKQPRFPVIFITAGLSPQWDIPVDIRARSVQEGVMYTKAENLLGINIDSTPLLARPELIRSILSEDLVLFTWGSLNNDPTNIDLQKQLGVDAVIYDKINYFMPRRRSIFEVETDDQSKAQ